MKFRLELNSPHTSIKTSSDQLASSYFIIHRLDFRTQVVAIITVNTNILKEFFQQASIWRELTHLLGKTKRSRVNPFKRSHPGSKKLFQKKEFLEKTTKLELERDYPTTLGKLLLMPWDSNQI